MDARCRPTIDIVLGDGRSHVRQDMQTALRRQGFRSVRAFSRLREVSAAADVTIPDLLILDIDMDREACDFVRATRFHERGRNPFVPVILTTWHPRIDIVQAGLDCGTDQIVVKPLSEAALLRRMDMLIERRKPFIVTSDYIGPDRRDDADGRSEAPGSAAPIDVPNTLRAKARGEPIATAALAQTIDEAIDQVNEQKMRRNAFRIVMLVELLVAALQEAGDGAAFGGTGAGRSPEACLAELTALAEDSAARLLGTPFAHNATLCQSLARLARSIGRQDGGPAAPPDKALRLLRPLAEAILVGFNPERRVADMAGEIGEAIDRYRRQQARTPAAASLRVRKDAPRQPLSATALGDEGWPPRQDGHDGGAFSPGHPSHATRSR